MTVHATVQKHLVSLHSLSLEQRTHALDHLRTCKQCQEANALFQQNAQALAYLQSPDPPASTADAVFRRIAETRTAKDRHIVSIGSVPKFPRMKHVVALSIVSVVMLIGGLSIAAAASPSVRVALQHVLPFPLPGNAGAASNAQGEPIAIYPKPPFTIFYPRPVPTGMLIHVIIHFKNGTPVAGPTGGANCGLDPHPGVCAQRIANLSVLLGIFPGMKDSPYSSTLAQPIWKRNVDVVWFGMRTFPPRGGYIELAEWRNRALPLVLHRNAQINGHYAMVRKHGLFTMVSVVRDGTAVVLRSNMGREFTLRAAASLQKIAIAGRSG